MILWEIEMMPKLPTEGDLKELPLRATVAYAVRCAMRVRPLYTFAVPIDDPTLEFLVDVAARVAAAQPLDETIEITELSVAKPEIDTAASRAVFEAGEAARCAVLAAKLAIAPHVAGFSGQATVAASAAIAASEALEAVDSIVDDDERFMAAAQADYDRLLAAKLGEFPELGEPVDVSDLGLLGPLWPEGPPEWFAGPPTVEIVVGIDPDFEVLFDPSLTRQDIEFALTKLADYYRACGGAGFKIEFDEESADVPEGVYHDE